MTRNRFRTRVFHINGIPFPSAKSLNMIRIQSVIHQMNDIKVKMRLRQLATVFASSCLLLAANGLQIQHPAKMRHFKIPHRMYRLSLRERMNQSMPTLPKRKDTANVVNFDICLYEHGAFDFHVIHPLSQ